MLDKMTDTQRFVLQAAAAREDRLLRPPGNARGAVAKAIAANLMEAGWAREIEAANDAPVWRRDAATGGAYALKLTAKGLKAAAAAGEQPDGSGNSSPPVAAEVTTPNAIAPEPTLLSNQIGTTDREPSAAASTTSPRAGSKLANVLARLSAEGGATIGELTIATGWLEHTTRAALTGLRRRGYTLSLTRGERDGASVYRISAVGGEATTK